MVSHLVEVYTGKNASPVEVVEARRGLCEKILGGSWYLLTNYNCTYNPLMSP